MYKMCINNKLGIYDKLMIFAKIKIRERILSNTGKMCCISKLQPALLGYRRKMRPSVAFLP